MRSFFSLLFCTCSLLLLSGCTDEFIIPISQTSLPETSLPIESITLPEGFQIAVVAEGIEGARSIAIQDPQTIYVSTRTQGNLYKLVDTTGDGYFDTTHTLLTGRDMPNGIALVGTDLFIAERTQIIKIPNIHTYTENPPIEMVYQGLPDQQHHGWKYLALGPDNKLYFSVGAPCNVCKGDQPLHSTIARINTDGSHLELFAEGVRNSIGFDWHPRTQELWFTDNGRDLMGDNLPPDELNHAPRKGMHFGFPYVHGTNIEDPTYYPNRPRQLSFTNPIQELGPHVAALGMQFYRGSTFPSSYQHQIFIAEHGSWNRSEPIGYRISLVRFGDNGDSTYEVFADGWLNAQGTAWGRPVDIAETAEGALLISDDRANAIYRIWHD